MSFAKDVRAKRRTAGLSLTALVASLSLGTSAIPPVPVQVVTGQSASSVAPREFADTSAVKRRASKTVQNRVTGRKRARLDTRKSRRRWLMQMADRDNSGRQWVRVRKAIRNGPAAPILQFPTWRLIELYAAGQRLVFAPKAA